jgi:hypothetical protein
MLKDFFQSLTDADKQMLLSLTQADAISWVRVRLCDTCGAADNNIIDWLNYLNHERNSTKY